MQRVLVTGGAGFIGSHVVDLLLKQGCQVMSFDCLMPQVHPNRPDWPTYQPDQPNLERWCGDVRDSIRALMPALLAFKPDTIIHLAALVGVGQSTYQPAVYTSANITGTMNVLDCVYRYNREAEESAHRRATVAGLPAQLWEEMLKKDPEPRQEDGTLWTEAAFREAAQKEVETQLKALPSHGQVAQVFVAGSMSSYGEGAVEWQGEEQLRPVGTAESQPLAPTSIYAWTKAQQEEGALLLAELLGLDVRVGRFFNCYGNNQSLTNPYTGVGAIFSARALAGLCPVVYEDGGQSRDFIHVSDVTRAILTILEQGEPRQVYNVGTGVATSVLELATRICEELHQQDPEQPLLTPQVTGLVRVGDIRHCFAEVSRLKALGWEPQVTLETGVRELIGWVRQQPQTATQELLDRAHTELVRHGLLVDPE